MDSLELAPKVRVLFGMDKKDLRDKLFAKGALTLSDSELIALILRCSPSKRTVKSLPKKILRCIDKDKNRDLEKELRKIKDLTDNNISALVAAFELGRRYHGSTFGKINKPTDVLPYLKHYSTRKVEHFISISLTGANEIINIRVVSVGTLMNTLAHPREVFADVITDRAASVIFAHNHPSGSCEPSDADLRLTYNLVDAGDILGIEVLDHIIFSPRDEYTSLSERGIISGKSIVRLMSEDYGNV